MHCYFCNQGGGYHHSDCPPTLTNPSEREEAMGGFAVGELIARRGGPYPADADKEVQRGYLAASGKMEAEKEGTQ